jgi:formylglycine-generating enzyme required for sulfatase activity
MRYFILLVAVVLLKIGNAQLRFIKIPKQNVFYRFNAGTSNPNVVEIQKFKISKQITFGEYKEFLLAIKRDSTDTFYKKQIPKIIGQPQLTAAYNLTNEYDQLPVIGVSFESACNYSNWYKNKYGKKGKEYRLPTIMEWLSMYRYSQTKIKDSTISKSFLADWTINSYDKSMYEASSNKLIEHFNCYEPNDPIDLKRKCIIGHSFRYSVMDPMDMIWHPYYGNEGYVEVGFRIIEILEDDKFLKFCKPFNYVE